MSRKKRAKSYLRQLGWHEAYGPGKPNWCPPSPEADEGYDYTLAEALVLALAEEVFKRREGER